MSNTTDANEKLTRPLSTKSRQRNACELSIAHDPKVRERNIHSLSYHELTTHSQSVGAGARQSAGEMRCTTFLSSAMSVLSGVGAVEVDVGTAHESTVLELCLDVRPGDALPCRTHPPLNVPQRERPIRQHTLSPHVEQGIVERTEALGRCRWNADDLHQLLAPPVMELLLDLFLAVNGRSIKVEEEGVDIQRASGLSEKSADVLQQHLTRHSLVSLAW